jgi:hypothetical protein
MGCGSSNTLECSDFRNKEKQLLTNYKKIVDENYKTIQKNTDNNFEDACKNVENDADVETLLKEMNESYPKIGLTPQEQKDCCLYSVAKNLISKNAEESVKNNGEYLIDLLSNTDSEVTSKLSKVFIENVGPEFKAVFVNLESSAFIAKMALQVLRFDEALSKYTTIILLISEALIEDEAFMKDIGSLLKLNSSLKNFVLGISDADGKKSAAAFDNITYVFEGVVLSKCLQNFGVLRLMTNDFTLKPESVNKISNCISSCKLNSLGIANLCFKGEDRNKILAAISKNAHLSLVGVQIIGTSANDIEAIIKQFIGAAALKWLICGVQVDDFEGAVKKNEGSLKTPKNSKFEGLVIDYFKK